jgi:hypothetical protein
LIENSEKRPLSLAADLPVLPLRIRTAGRFDRHAGPLAGRGVIVELGERSQNSADAQEPGAPDLIAGARAPAVRREESEFAV